MLAQPVLQPSTAPLPQTTSLHLLPFSLAYDGPAPIDRFFHPRPYPSDVPSASSAPPLHRQAAFRGRRVVSSLLPLPTGYKGVVLASSAPALPSSSSTNDAGQEEEDSAQQQEREERAAKRAKRAAESAAALSAPVEESGRGSRRSPRKSVAEAARRRAVEAAKKKGKAAKGKGKGKFSLDDDDEEEEQVDGVEPVQEVQKEEEVKEQDEEPVKEEKGPGEEAMQVDVVETVVSTAVEGTDGSAVISVETATTAETATTSAAETEEPTTAAPPPPAPLLSRTSTATSSAIPSTPLTSTASIDSLSADKNPFDAADSLSTPADRSLEEPTEVQRDVQLLRPILSFSAIEVWNADFPIAGGRVEEDDEVGRAVSEWLGVAEKIHAY